MFLAISMWFHRRKMDKMARTWEPVQHHLIRFLFGPIKGFYIDVDGKLKEAPYLKVPFKSVTDIDYDKTDELRSVFNDITKYVYYDRYVMFSNDPRISDLNTLYHLLANNPGLLFRLFKNSYPPGRRPKMFGVYCQDGSGALYGIVKSGLIDGVLTWHCISTDQQAVKFNSNDPNVVIIGRIDDAMQESSQVINEYLDQVRAILTYREIDYSEVDLSPYKYSFLEDTNTQRMELH